MGSPYLVIILAFSYADTLFSAITGDSKRSRERQCSSFLFFMFSPRMSDKRKEEGEEGTETLYLPPSSISPMASCWGTN